MPFWRQGFLPPPRTASRLFVECVPRRWLAKYCLTASQSRLRFGLTAKTSSASSSCLTVAPSRFLTSTVAILVLSGQSSVASCHCHDRLLTPLILRAPLALNPRFLSADCSLPSACRLLPTLTYAAPLPREPRRNCLEDPEQHPPPTRYSPRQALEPRADCAPSHAHCPYGLPLSSL